MMSEKLGENHMNTRFTDKQTLDKNWKDLSQLVRISAKNVHKLQSLPGNFLEDDYRILEI